MRSVKPAAATRADIGHAVGRDATSGRFATGNSGAAQLRLLDIETSQAAPWLRPALERAQRRFRGARLSGLYRQTGSRLDGMLRAACMADCMHEALATHAVTLPVNEAREVYAEAAKHARDAKGLWLKLFALVGLKRGAADADPLAKLANELNGDIEGEEADDE